MGKRGRVAEAAGSKRRTVLQLDNSIRKDKEAAAAAAAGVADSAAALSVPESVGSRLAGGLVLLGAYADSDDDDDDDGKTGPPSPLERPRDLDSKVADFLAEIDAISVPGPSAEGDDGAEGENGQGAGADGVKFEASTAESGISESAAEVTAGNGDTVASDGAVQGGWHYDTHYSTATSGIEMGEWQEVWDENTGCYYYWHLQTNQVTWELPPALALQIQHLQHLNNGHFPGASEIGATEPASLPSAIHAMSSVEKEAQTKPIVSTIAKPKDINERVCALTSEEEGRSVGVAESLLAPLIPESVRQAEARWRHTLHGPGSPSSLASLSAPASPAPPSHQPGIAMETEPLAGKRERVPGNTGSSGGCDSDSSRDGGSDKEDEADDGRNNGGDDEEDSDQELKHILETKRAELRALEDGGGSSSRSSTPRRDDAEDGAASATTTEPKPKWKTFVRAASPLPPERAAPLPVKEAHDMEPDEQGEETDKGRLKEELSLAAGSVSRERSPVRVQDVDAAGAIDTGDEEEEADDAAQEIMVAEDDGLTGRIGTREDDDDGEGEEEVREGETPPSSQAGAARKRSRAPDHAEEARKKGGGGGGRVDPEEDNDQVKFVIAELANDLTSKLGFLGISTRTVSNFQLLLLTTQTRLADWREGFLDSCYLKRRLQEGAAQLAQYECNATPKGWACTWDRTHARYYYTNERTGASQWEFPNVADEGGGGGEDAGQGEGPVRGVSVETTDWLTLNRPLMTDAFAVHVEQPSMSASLRDVPLLPPPVLPSSSLASFSDPLTPLAALPYALPSVLPYPLVHPAPLTGSAPLASAPPQPPSEPLPPPPPESPPPPPPPPESPPPPPPPMEEDDDIEEVDMQLETGTGEPPPPGLEEPAPPLPPPLKASKAPTHVLVATVPEGSGDTATGKDETIRAVRTIKRKVPAVISAPPQISKPPTTIGSKAMLYPQSVLDPSDPLVAMVPGAWAPGEPLSNIITTVHPPSITVPTHSAPPSGHTLTTSAAVTVATDKSKKTKKLKKVSGKVKGKMPPLVQKWKSIQRELEEEERGSSSEDGEPQDAATRIISWRREQMITGKSERNANFEALPEDWRERLKRRKMNPR